MVDILNAVKIVFFILVVTAISACSSVKVSEDSFLRDRKSVILYQALVKNGVTVDELASTTFYKKDKIKSSLLKLNEKGLVEFKEGKWHTTNKYREEEYAQSISSFSLSELRLSLMSHDVSFEQVADKFGVAEFNSDTANVALIVFPGNGFNANPDMKEVKKLLAPNRSVYVMEYPGMGLNAHPLTIDTLYETSSMFMDYVLSEIKGDSSIDTIVVYGFSLGGFLAVDVAGRYAVDGLVLDSTAPNIKRWIDANVPLVAKPFVDVEVDTKLAAVDNLGKLSKIEVPILIFGGDNDDITPLSMAYELRDSAKVSERVEVEVISGVGHGEIIDHADFLPSLDLFVSGLN